MGRSQKARICPECGESFFQRREGCCPNCGVALKLCPGGKTITQREYGRKVEILAHFQELCKLPVYFDPGSRGYVNELAYAGNMVRASCKFLGYWNRFDIDPTDFAIKCLDYLFTSSSQANWAAQINSLRMCNGGTFDNVAPRVFEQIREEEQQAKAQDMHEAGINNRINVMVLG